MRTKCELRHFYDRQPQPKCSFVCFYTRVKKKGMNPEDALEDKKLVKTNTRWKSSKARFRHEYIGFKCTIDDFYKKIKYLWMSWEEAVKPNTEEISNAIHPKKWLNVKTTEERDKLYKKTKQKEYWGIEITLKREEAEIFNRGYLREIEKLRQQECYTPYEESDRVRRLEKLQEEYRTFLIYNPMG